MSTPRPAPGADDFAAWNAMSMSQRLRVYFELKARLDDALVQLHEAKLDAAESGRLFRKARTELEAAQAAGSGAETSLLREALVRMGEDSAGQKRKWFVTLAQETLKAAKDLAHPTSRE